MMYSYIMELDFSEDPNYIYMQNLMSDVIKGQFQSSTINLQTVKKKSYRRVRKKTSSSAINLPMSFAPSS